MKSSRSTHHVNLSRPRPGVRRVSLKSFSPIIDPFAARDPAPACPACNSASDTLWFKPSGPRQLICLACVPPEQANDLPEADAPIVA
ncbi:MAG TPA: hypothetical protein VGE74_27005 [Gemmata sp.]